MDTNHTELESPGDVKEKVEQLLARMTLEEKVGQLIQVGQHWRADADAQTTIETYIRAGQIGSILSLRDVKAINRLQKVAVEESRLGIPLIIGNDVIHGYRTIFPIPLAESCTWAPDLLERAAHIAATEAAVSGTDWIFAPMVDVCRDPRWGRIAEGAGEDPMLGQAMARARVRGFQAADLPGGRKIVACPKHYVAYGGAEAGKDYNTVDVSERTLRDVHLPPFKAAFDAGAGSVMSAFNEINGVPASANAFTLRTVLREEWGFAGVILSDYDAIGELIPHGFALDLKEAAYKSIMAGVDMDMMSNAFFEHLANLVREEKVPQMIVDDAVRRVLRLKVELGLFEHPYTDETLAETVILHEDYKEVALEVAQKSMVLLKNEGDLLPLSPATTSIAVIGPLADDRHAPLGCWACEGRPEDVETMLDSLKALKPHSVTLTHVRGCSIHNEDPTDEEHSFKKAVAAAHEADVVIMVLGESAAMSGEAHSRAYLGLPGQQQALLEAVYATGTPVVAVLMSGRPLVIPWMAEHVPAILQAWHGGIRTGRAVANILFGYANPSGKLTASFPRTEGQIPVYYAHKNTGRPMEGPGTMQFNQAHKSQYLDEVNAPQFAFGHGLSYTTFSYSDLQVETPVLGADKNSPLEKTLGVTAIVQNTGDRAGDEIVQLYTRDLVGSVTRPVKELKGFQRISLKAGERALIRFEVPVRQLGFHGLDMHYRVEPGKFKVWIGPNSTEGLEGEFEVKA
jgi:beta-glucosidase